MNQSNENIKIIQTANSWYDRIKIVSEKLRIAYSILRYGKVTEVYPCKSVYQFNNEEDMNSAIKLMRKGENNSKPRIKEM